MTDKACNDLAAQLIALDKELMELINRRALLTKRLKRTGDQMGSSAFGCLNMQSVMSAIEEFNRGPVNHELMASVFTEIAAACRDYRPNQKIAFLGGEGSFCQLAAVKNYGKAQDYLSCMSIKDVFRAVERDQAVLGVVPVENSLEGSVIATVQELLRSELKIVSEVYLSVSYSLLSGAENAAGVKTVLAPKYALDHCRDWLTRNLAQAGRDEAASSMAAIQQAQKNPELAVLASSAAARPNGLSVLAEDIQDERGIRNRYLVVGRGLLPETGRDKTSLLFTSKHRPGALLRALSCFAEHGVNLSRIESRPVMDPTWKYMFFADVEGNAQEANLAKALLSLESQTEFMKVLGVYPNAEPITPD